MHVYSLGQKFQSLLWFEALKPTLVFILLLDWLKKGWSESYSFHNYFGAFLEQKPSLLVSDLSHYAPNSNDGPFGCSTGHKSLSNSLCNQEGTLEETQRER